MAGLSEWNKAVKMAFKMGRKTNKNYSLKNAMFDAKKIYKKGANAVISIGKMGGRKSRRNRRMRGGSNSNTLMPAQTSAPPKSTHGGGKLEYSNV